MSGHSFSISWLENHAGYSGPLAFGRVEHWPTFVEAVKARDHRAAHPELWVPLGGHSPVVSDVTHERSAS